MGPSINLLITCLRGSTPLHFTSSYIFIILFCQQAHASTHYYSLVLSPFHPSICRLQGEGLVKLIMCSDVGWMCGGVAPSQSNHK